MRTAQICPTCTTFVNSKCVIYDGPVLSNINVSPMDDLNTILSSLNTAILPINGTIAPVANAKFVGQLYVDTIEPALYYASAVGNGAGDWEKITLPAPLGYTPENVANKSTDVTLSANSDTLYPSQRAVKTYADTKQPLLGFAPENVTNKSTDVTLGGATPSNIKYPSQKAVKEYVDANAGALPYQSYVAIVDFGISGFTETILQNDFTGVTYTWSNPTTNVLRITPSDGTAFTLDKTVVFVNSYDNTYLVTPTRTGSPIAGVVNLTHTKYDGTTNTLSYGQFYIEIRVYP